jgi:hypothetical protein
VRAALANPSVDPWQITLTLKEIDMFIKIAIARLCELARSRNLIGLLGAISANAVLAATVEQLTRVAT